MKRHLLKLTAAALCMGLVGAAAHADTVRLRFQTYYGTEMDKLGKEMRDTIREKSNGEMRMQYFRGGELAQADQMVDATARGTIDVAYGVGSYWPGQVDVANVEAGLPGAWTSAAEAGEVFKQFNPILEKAYAEKGVTLIGRGFGSNYDLLTKKPVQSLEDLKGSKIRATGQMAKVLEGFDIKTVFLPAEELYVALSTGIIDGVLYGGPVEYEQLKFDEVAKYYTYLNFLNPGWTDTIIVNTKVWEGMTEAQRTILRDAAQTYANGIHAWLEEGNAKTAKDSKRMEFATLPEADSKALAQAAQQVWQDEAKKSDRVARMVDILTENAKKQGRLD
ncbi:MAG: TRAP transporter substrate-binding protein DctP [Castellaniella sp.]